MSYAIIQTGGKQYKVKAGEIIKIEKLDKNTSESKLEFKEILAYGDDKMIEVGSPTISGAKVEANLVENGKDRTILIFKKSIEIGEPIIQGAKVEANLIKNSKNRTILIFKKRRRQNSRRKNGHRQRYSLIKVSKIFSKDGKVLSEAKEIVKLAKKNEKIDIKKVKTENFVKNK